MNSGLTNALTSAPLSNKKGLRNWIESGTTLQPKVPGYNLGASANGIADIFGHNSLFSIKTSWGTAAIFNRGVGGNYSLNLGRADGNTVTNYDGICIGRFVTASGDSGLAMQYGSIAAGLYSQAFGLYSSTAIYGQYVSAAGRFAAVGDAQFARTLLRNKTTDASPKELFADGSSKRLTIASGKGFSGIVEVFGFKSDGTASARYTRRVGIKNVAGTTSLVGSVETIGTDHEDDAGTDVAITADDTNDALAITVTGIAAETWRWVAVVEGVELAYGT
jgi:hypothetical protein